MSDAFIVDGVRTPIGKHRGALATVRADDMAARVLGGVLGRSGGARELVEEVFFGATNQAGEDNRNVARMAVLLANLPYDVGGVTLNRLCGSGLEAVIAASRALRVGDYDVVVAGGVESMTRAPYVIAKSEEAFPRTPPALYDTCLGWRFPNPALEARFPLQSMGETAENVAAEYEVSRADQDAFALESHHKATLAWERGRFAEELVEVRIPGAKKGAPETVFERDESLRADSSLEALAKLRPVFRDGGSVTAGNSSPLNDGAAALLLCSERGLEQLHARPIARIVAAASAGVHPNVMGIGPIPATRKVLEKAKLTVDDLELIELNEAFAAQSLACIRTLGLDASKVNVNGGAIALGHPIGCSGARILVTLAHELRKRGGRFGLATLCIGVGQGLAVVIERV